jgi:hypothetical protein
MDAIAALNAAYLPSVTRSLEMGSNFDMGSCSIEKPAS